MTLTGIETLTDIRLSAVKWLDRMRQALSMNQFSVAYQPFVHVATDRVIGVEALSRWSDPDIGEIGPSIFIPIAEENGFILEFTEWLIVRAIGEIVSLSSKFGDLLLLINVSPHILSQREFCEYLERTVNPSIRHRLIFEITDNYHLPEKKEADFRSLATELMEKGFRFALDDFGTGHLDLRQVVLFPAHILKTNVSLIRHPENGRRGNLVIGLVAEVARELRMHVIAEGVENAEQWENVKTFGFEYAKGFFFCPPLQLKDLEARLASISPGRRALRTDETISYNGSGDVRQESFSSGNPVLILGGEKTDCQIELENRSQRVFIREAIENGIGILNQFDFIACIMWVENVETNHIVFLQQCRRFYQEMPIIVVTDGLDVSWVVRLMREGVTDFILYPNDSGEAVGRILNHIENREAMIRSVHSSERMVLQLRDRMEWESYKENWNISTDNRFGQKTIDHLRTSLTQGSGIGILISLMEMLSEQKPRTDGSRIIDADFMKMVMNNVRIAQKHIDGIESIVDLMKRDLVLKKACFHDFMNLSMEVLSGVSIYFHSKNIKLNLPVLREWGDFSLEVEIEYFRMAMQELAVNAYKYALPNTEVDLIVTIRAGYLCLGLKNIVSRSPFGGIPDELAENITEPFYRLRPPVEDVIEIETFGLGLGLTAVKFIMHKHRGMLSVKEVRDHSRDKVRPAVLASIFFPVEKNPCRPE